MIVLAIAAALGIGLYYAVRALPDDAPRFDPANVRIEPGNNQTDNPGFPPGGDRPEGGDRRDGGLSLRGFVGVAGKTVMFSVITFVTVLLMKLFKREPARPKTPGG